LAKWRKYDYSIEDFKIEEIQHYEEGKIADAMSDLKNTIGTYWDSIGNVDEYILSSRYEKEDY